MEHRLVLKLKGTTDMLMHNQRLRNPFDPYTRELAKLSKKRSKTEQDYAEIARVEARGAMYETGDGLLGLPVTNVWTCIREAGRAFRCGKLVEQAILPSIVVDPIYVGGKVQKCDDYLAEEGHILYCSAVNSGRRVMRSRPVVKAGWTAVTSFEIHPEVLDADRIAALVVHAGRYIGLGDWRPRFGLFAAAVQVLQVKP